MFTTRITSLFGIEHPIIQGGMQWLSRAELAAAVSEAGGLGILSAATCETKELLRDEIRKARALTGKPIGVNIPLFPAMRSLDLDGYIDVMIEEGVGIAETAGRSPEQYMEKFKKNNIKVMHKVTAVRFAQKAQQVGCDAVVIDGCECAGHPGEEDVTSMVLVPLTVDALNIPVVAAGGFADGRGLVAALALGADAVMMGTRFMISREAPMHPEAKEQLARLKETDTLVVLRSLRNSMRVIKNELSLKVAEAERNQAPMEEVLSLVSGIKGQEVLETGDLNAGVIACGQVIGLIKDIPSVQEIIERIMADAAKIRNGLASSG